MAELAIKFEQEFGFQISDEAAESIRTVGDAVKFIEKYAVARSVTSFVSMRVQPRRRTLPTQRRIPLAGKKLGVRRRHADRD
jgi:hypothetical protein